MNIWPNSIPREIRNALFDEQGRERVQCFCGSCHVGGPWVLKEMLETMGFVGYFCEPCAEKYGEDTLDLLAPDEVFFAEMKAACADKYGRDLLVVEILDQLGDPNSLMSKLARARADNHQKYLRAS